MKENAEIATTKALYATTIDEFNKIRQENVFEERLKDRSTKLGISPGTSETTSWKNNFKAINSLLTKAKLPDDVVIAFEYRAPIGGGRIDCMLFGKGEDCKKNIVHIELKQWSNENVQAFYDYHTFRADVIVDGNRQGSDISTHPSDQAKGYHEIFKHHVLLFDQDDINLHGFAYCYNYKNDTNQKRDLLDDSYKSLMEEIPLFCGDQKDVFAEKLNKLLKNGGGKEIFELLDNSKIGSTKRLHDVASRMLEGAEVYKLSSDQRTAFETILGAVRNTKNNEKTAIIIKGGPGTGKSVIALNLLSELHKEEYNCKEIFYATNATQFKNGLKEQLKGVGRQYNNKVAASLIESTYEFKPNNENENDIDVLIVDEAHRIKNSSNDQTDRTRPDRTYLPLILSLLYRSRVSIFFIDDRQSISKKEIGTSENIKIAANKYNYYILKSAEIFEDKAKRPNNDPILYKEMKKKSKLRNELKNLCEKLEKHNNELNSKTCNSPKYNDEEKEKINKKIEKTEKDINSHKRMLDMPIIKNEIRSIIVPDIIELKDQFRCNGSDNYLSWIDKVIYQEGEDIIKLNTDNYEFEIFDDPNLLYQKIRSLDDYARYADDYMKQKGDNFSYKELYNETQKMYFEKSARLVAGYCWDWNTKDNPQRNKETGDLNKEVNLKEFGFDFAMPWETHKNVTHKNEIKYKYAKDPDKWCNDKEGVNQIGCIHSIQGWETDYVGVIIGPDMKYDVENKCLYYAGENRDLKGKENDPILNRLVKNIYRVLLTRGKKGCFVFCCDSNLKDYFETCLKEGA